MGLLDPHQWILCPLVETRVKSAPPQMDAQNTIRAEPHGRAHFIDKESALFDLGACDGRLLQINRQLG